MMLYPTEYQGLRASGPGGAKRKSLIVNDLRLQKVKNFSF